MTEVTEVEVREGGRIRITREIETAPTRTTVTTAGGPHHGETATSKGTFLERVIYRVQFAAVCPDCEGFVCQADEPCYTTAAAVIVEPSPPVGEEHRTRIMVTQPEVWLDDHQVIAAFADTLAEVASVMASEDDQ